MTDEERDRKINEIHAALYGDFARPIGIMARLTRVESLVNRIMAAGVSLLTALLGALGFFVWGVLVGTIIILP